MKGAPIRFVAAVVGGWVCIRIAVLLPDVDRLELAGDVIAPPAAASGRPPTFAGAAVGLPPIAAPIRAADGGPRGRSGVRLSTASISVAAPKASPAQAATPDHASRNAERATPSMLIPVIAGSSPGVEPQNRWAASAWLLARGGANGTLTGGRLGASQAGVRTTYLLDRGRRLALAGRIAAPLGGRGTEAAIGIDWQPTTAPIHLVAEQRFAIDGARGGPTAMVIAGLNSTPVAADFRLEAYAQAGAILRDGKVQGFGDGAARLTRPVAGVGRTTLDLGLGAWGAGQTGAARVDVGPTIGAALPVAGQRIRVSLDWRQRVAGHARPGSGPALSIGSDF